MMEQMRNHLLDMKKTVFELGVILEAINAASPEEKEFMQKAILRYNERLKENSARLPMIINDELGKVPKKDASNMITLSSADKELFMTATRIEKEALKLARKKIEERSLLKKSAKNEGYTEAGAFTKMASKLFSDFSFKATKGDAFKSIGSDLRKANMPYLVPTYFSIALLSAFISIFMAILLAVVFWPMISYYAILIVVFLPPITFVAVLFYPISEGSSTRAKIDDELPFAIMHMAAIAGSGVEPTKIFGILAVSNEYPTVKLEMRKLVNQINFYGMNLTNALKSTAKNTPSDRLAELFNGMATTLSSGGDLRSYLGKIADDSLLDYKLRRKKFTTLAETYADIYTGLLIAAPLMFMLILVLMNVMGGGLGGLSSTTLAIIGIGGLIALNIGFLVFLQISQPDS